MSVNKFFFKSLQKKKPFTKVKMAISSDNKIAWNNYKSKWITNSKSRSLCSYFKIQKSSNSNYCKNNYKR